MLLAFLLMALILASLNHIGLSIPGSASMVDAENAQTHTSDILAILGSMPGQSNSAGQSFISRRSGLDSLTLWLADATSAESGSTRSAPAFSVAIFHSLQDSTPIYQASYRLPKPGYSGAFRVTFPPILDPPGQSYTVQVMGLSGAIQVRGRDEDSYSSGQAFVNREAVTADLAFSMTYRYGTQAILEDLGKIFKNFWLFIPLGLTLLLPGWLLLDWLKLLPRLTIWNRLAVSAGLSLALLPLAMFWSGLIGLKWNAEGVKVLMLILTALTAWRLYERVSGLQRMSARFARFSFTARQFIHSQLTWNNLVMGGILALTIFLRTAMVRDLAFPAWVDSVHHALITRLVQTQGGIPTSYAPYFTIQPTAYHPGFHSGVAVFQWLSGLSLPDALQVYGQALNVLGVLAASLFTFTFTRNRFAASGAALAAGLLTPLPAYLASWGRYTHLAGLIIFCAILAIINHIRASRLKDFRNWNGYFITMGLALAGLILVHYRVAAFLACWWAAELLSNIGNGSIVKNKLRILAMTTLSGGIFILPWIIPMVRYTFLPRLGASSGVITELFGDFDPSLLTAAYGGIVLGIAGIGLAIAFFRHTRLAIVLSLWTAVLFLLANLGALRIPGGAFVNNVSIEITLYLPICMLAGYTVAQFKNLLSAHLPVFGRYFFSGLISSGVMVLALAGFTRLLPILNPSTVLARSADLPAMTWMTENIPSDEWIAINPFIWGYGLCAGSDGGFWIAPLTGHPTNPPPLLYSMGQQDDALKVQVFCQTLIRLGAYDPPAIWNALQSEGIHYVYIGSRGGVLSAQVLSESPDFQVIYHQDGTWVFRTLP